MLIFEDRGSLSLTGTKLMIGSLATAQFSKFHISQIISTLNEAMESINAMDQGLQKLCVSEINWKFSGK